MSNVYCLTFGCTQSGDYKYFYNNPFFCGSYYYYGCTPNPDGTCQGMYPVYLCPSDLCWYDICNPDLTENSCYESQCLSWLTDTSYVSTYVLEKIEQTSTVNRCHLSILPIPASASSPMAFVAKTDGNTWWLESDGQCDFIPLGDIGRWDGKWHSDLDCICEYLISQGRFIRGCALNYGYLALVRCNCPAYTLNFSCYTSCIDYKVNDCPTIVPTYMTVCSSGQPEEKPVVSLSYKDKQVWSYGYSDTSCKVKCYCNFPMDTSPVCFGGTPVDTLRYNNTNNILHKGTISSGTHVDVSGACCCAKWDGEVTYPTNTYCVYNPMCSTASSQAPSVVIPQTCYRCECCFCKTCITEYNLKVCGVEIAPHVRTYAPDYYYAIPECESSLAIPIKSAWYSNCCIFYSRTAYVACIDKDKVNGFLDDLIDQFVAAAPSNYSCSGYANFDRLCSLRIALPLAGNVYCPINCCISVSRSCQAMVLPLTPDRELIKTLAGINCCWTDCGAYCTFSHCGFCTPLETMLCCSRLFCDCANTAANCIRSYLNSLSIGQCMCISEILDTVVDCLKHYNLSIFRGYPTCVDIYSLAAPVYSMGSCAKDAYQYNIDCIKYATNCGINLVGNNLCGNCECICWMTAKIQGPAGTQYADKRCWTVSYCSYPETCCLTPIGTVDFSCPYNKLSCMDAFNNSLSNFKCPVDESTYQRMANVLFCNGSSMFQFNRCAMAVVPSEERTLAGRIFMQSNCYKSYAYNYDDLMEYFKTKFDNLSNTCASPYTTAICNAYSYGSQWLCYTPKICYHGMLPVPQFSIGLYKGCY